MSDDSPLAHQAPAGGTVHLDARSVRGLAHPLRVKILGLLRTDGPATATTLAEQLGQNTGATSYHLRQLAAYGFIVEDDTRGTGRERWWRAAHVTTRFDRTTMGIDESGEAFLRSIGQIYMEKIQGAIDQQATLPPEWRDAGTLSDWIFRLTPDEARRLTNEVYAVMSRYRSNDPDDPGSAPEGAVRFSVQVQAFPHSRDIESLQADHTPAEPGHPAEPAHPTDPTDRGGPTIDVGEADS